MPSPVADRSIAGRPPAPGVRRIDVPPAARALSTLTRIDYEDAFLVELGGADERTGEAWARATLEDASAPTRRRLRWGWFALGLELGGAPPDRSVLGWELRRSTPDFALLGARSRLGMAGELLFEPRGDTLLFATFLGQENPLARAIWGAVAPRHREVVASLLRRAARGHRPRR
jgi:hypothetical protein